MVGGREVITPFFVTEVYIKQPDNTWKLSVLAFTSRPQMPTRQKVCLERDCKFIGFLSELNRALTECP